MLFHVDKPETPGYKIELPEDGAKQIVEKKLINLRKLILPHLAMGDLAHGEKVFKKCSACHVVDKGGENKIGPCFIWCLRKKSCSN